MNKTELGILSKSLGCEFKDAQWRPYHQYNLVAYKNGHTYLAGYSVVVCIWQKKTSFKVLNVKGEIWFSFNIEHEYNLCLWSREQIEGYLLQQVAVQKTKEMFSNLANAKLENYYKAYL